MRKQICLPAVLMSVAPLPRDAVPHTIDFDQENTRRRRSGVRRLVGVGRYVCLPGRQGSRLAGKQTCQKGSKTWSENRSTQRRRQSIEFGESKRFQHHIYDCNWTTMLHEFRLPFHRTAILLTFPYRGIK
ncbi:hypothetical protein PSPO01_01595 [Paraphaeosphaeria sporulosa]